MTVKHDTSIHKRDTSDCKTLYQQFMFIIMFHVNKCALAWIDFILFCAGGQRGGGRKRPGQEYVVCVQLQVRFQILIQKPPFNTLSDIWIDVPHPPLHTLYNVNISNFEICKCEIHINSSIF